MFRYCALLMVACLAATSAKAADPSFPLKDGDIWVMAGDSITAQHLHSNYFEAFCFARYPKMTFAFRNSGVGGHTIPSTLARFDYDIGAWKPTVVSVELGMNDAGGTPTETFVRNMDTMVARIRSAGARPVILSASPVNDGTLSGKLFGHNQKLDSYAKALRLLCEREQLPYADQFHICLDPWGKNKPMERALQSIGVIKQLSTEESIAGVEHLRTFLAVQEKSPVKGVNLQGDPVHPGPPGQLMMAAALLKELGAERFVSSVTVDANSGKAEAKGCTVSEIQKGSNGLSFERLDSCLPFPIADDARAVLALSPEVTDLSQYMLTVKGLKNGEYTLKIGGVDAGQFSAQALSQGVNLTTLSTANAHPIVVQMRAILNAVSAKENLVGNWRGLSQRAHARGAEPKLKEELAKLTKQVEEADKKIRLAATPKSLKFEIVGK